MAEYTIPKAERAPLNKLRELPEEILNSYVSALERAPDEVPEVEGLNKKDGEHIKDAVLALYGVRDFFEEELPEFTLGIAEGLRDATGFSSEEVPRFSARLQRLLTLTPLGLAAKAQSLRLEYERRFCSARVMTDARPVYVYSAAGHPEAVMITHMLRITYHDDTSEMREIYIQMDSDDIAGLKSILDRAEAKAKSLESVFASVNIPVLTS